jgi:hypothetical protein
MSQQTRYWIFCFLLFAFQSAMAQLNLPKAEEVYGGRINWMDAVALDASTTRLYISTESANSLFYTHINHSVTPVEIDTFATVPDVDSDDGFGGNIRQFAANATSGRVFFISMGSLYSADVTPGSLTLVENGGIFGVTCYGDQLFYLKEDMGNLDLHYGVVDSSTGSFAEDVNSPVTVASGVPGGGFYQLNVNPSNEKLYVFRAGNPPAIYSSSSNVTSLTATTSFNALDVTGLGSGIDYRAFGIGPDGRLFVGTVHGMEPHHFKFIGYTDTDGASWDTLSTAIGGTFGPAITCAGNDSTYFVFFGSAVSNNRGEAGTWQPVAWNSFETHPNDGVVAADPNNPAMVFVTTDQGIAASENYGADIYEIDQGVEAVQVNDFDMNGAKSIAWTASKSGVRRVSNYATTGESWEVFFPMGDGSPYYSIAMDTSDASGNTAYAGNARVYKTTDGGANWSRVFSVEDPGYSFDFWSYISAIRVNPHDPNNVVVGVNSPSMGVKGGLFYSTDAGATWQQLDTEPYNTEVKDLLFQKGDDGTLYLYVACEYVSDGTTSSYGVKTVTVDTNGTVTFNNDMPGETGTNITNFGANSLAINSNGDVYAAGRRGSDESPRVYVKYADSTHWEMLSTASLPATGAVSAITIGYDSTGAEVPYVAIESDIYYLPAGGGAWQMAYQYPVGNRINVLFWDDLLVGTGTGLYEQSFMYPTAIVPGDAPTVARQIELYQNYPNPFNPATTIEYYLPKADVVSLKVFDITGREVRTLLHQWQAGGLHQVQWDGRDAHGAQVASGIYLYQLKTAQAVRARKMVYMR